MPQNKTRHVGTIRVPDDVVEVSKGVYLPAGDYQATIETNHISIRGSTVDQVGTATIEVTEKFLQGIGAPPAAGSATSASIEVSKYLIGGTVKEV